MPSELLDLSAYERWRAQRMSDPEFRGAYERSAGEIAQTDQVIRALDDLRVDLGVSKAELARRIGRNASSIRRLFTASSVRPELPLIAAIADALGAEVRVVPKTAPARKRSELMPGLVAPKRRASTRAPVAKKRAVSARANGPRKKLPA